MIDAISCNEAIEGEEKLSAFAQSLHQIEQQAGEFCHLKASSEEHLKGFWPNLQQLIESGYNNLATNYELLVSGEIGAIYVVALIPLLLGVILEVMLILSNKRKERHIEERQLHKLTLTHGRVIADKVIETPSKHKRLYAMIKYGLVGAQVFLIGLFFIAVPEYDRDVWCEEHKTQYAIIMAGLETEKLQQWQRKANCEIRQAVVAINESVGTLGNVFSKENQSTLKSLKLVSSNVNNSLKKLDTTKRSIDSFSNKLEVVNLNSDAVIETLDTIENVAQYIGLPETQNPIEPDNNLTARLEKLNKDFVSALSQYPSNEWYLENLVTNARFETLLEAQSLQGNILNQFQSDQQSLQLQVRQLQQLLLSDEFINTLSAKVSEKVKQQSFGPIRLTPSQSSSLAPLSPANP